MQLIISRTGLRCEEATSPHPRAVWSTALKVWTVEVTSLDDLFTLVEGEMVIWSKDGHKFVEDYADYRE